MKIIVSMLFAAALVLPSVSANAVVLDLSTMTCKQFIEGGDDEIKMVLTWMDGWYKGDEDEAIIDTDVFVENAKKFGAFCAANPTISIVHHSYWPAYTSSSRAFSSRPPAGGHFQA